MQQEEITLLVRKAKGMVCPVVIASLRHSLKVGSTCRTPVSSHQVSVYHLHTQPQWAQPCLLCLSRVGGNSFISSCLLVPASLFSITDGKWFLTVTWYGKGRAHRSGRLQCLMGISTRATQILCLKISRLPFFSSSVEF